MAEAITIAKNAALAKDEDYGFLRSEGLKYIEELGSDLWTDYNEHDPGITILEALCYAITELGYRSSLPVKDWLTEKDGSIASSQALFTPKNILTQAPLTINDYRKLLIDCDGIHNAWLVSDNTHTDNGMAAPVAEVSLFADCKNDQLITKPKLYAKYNLDPITLKPKLHPVYISGLYKVLLDLEDNPQAGILNNGEIEILSPAINGYNAGAVSFTVMMPAWNDESLDKNLWIAKADSIAIVSSDITVSGSNWILSLSFSFSTQDNDEVHTASLQSEVIINLKPANKTVAPADMQAFFSTSFLQQLLSLYFYKIQTARRVVLSAIKKLHENRNLCEDFISVTTIPDEEIAICCDIDVAPDADMDKVQADVFFAIEQYLNPPVNFYLLKDLVAKGRTTDEIFEGPKLSHGFIDTDELEQTKLRENVYASDIISLVMDVKGVQAVRNLRMMKYGVDGKPVKAQTGQAWCMPVTNLHKPVFSETRSKILFFKNRIPFLPSLAEVRDTLRWLHAVNANNKLTGYTDDLPVPVGRYSELDEYTSLSYLLPQTYGVGVAGLPSNATPARRAAANQLKGYLLLYDQLLAGFFSQLKGAKSLLGTDTSVQTYYSQYVADTRDIDAVYKQDGSHHSLLKAVLDNSDSSLSTANDWQNLFESNETFSDRRNRFLDHLMARFAESFNDYVMLMYSLDFDTQKETKIDPLHVISSKTDFIKTYPQVSYERAKAFNYFPLQETDTLLNYRVDETLLWDTDNVSGLEKKATRLAGISNITRRYLYCFTQADIVITTDEPAKYKFEFSDEGGYTITSFTAYETRSNAVIAAASFIDAGKQTSQYSVEASGANQHLVIKDSSNNALAISSEFADEASANEAISIFVSLFTKECDSEGIHLIEHLLLRPRNILFALPPVCLSPDCDFCGEQDPFSFRMSVILPYWPNHFKNVAFRDYFEEMIRREAPAHTLVKICWLNNDAMRSFEAAYRLWLTALANYTYDASFANINTLNEANDGLVNILFYLHSEYPLATLHDCDDSEGTNPVMLGRTILGSFKPQ